MRQCYGDVRSLIGMDGVGTGIYEEDQSIYTLKEMSEEERLFNVNATMRDLIESLESNNNILTENSDESETQQEA